MRVSTRQHCRRAAASWDASQVGQAGSSRTRHRQTWSHASPHPDPSCTLPFDAQPCIKRAVSPGGILHPAPVFPGCSSPCPAAQSSGGTITPHQTATVGPADPPLSQTPPSPHRDSRGSPSPAPQAAQHRGAPAPCTVPAPWPHTRLCREPAESGAITLPHGPARLPAGWESSAGSPPHRGDTRAAGSSASTGMSSLKLLLHSPRHGMEGHELKCHEN